MRHQVKEKKLSQNHCFKSKGEQVAAAAAALALHREPVAAARIRLHSMAIKYN